MPPSTNWGRQFHSRDGIDARNETDNIGAQAHVDLVKVEEADPANSYGYRVVTLTDCVAGTSAAEHHNAIAYDYPLFSAPVESSTVIAALL